MTKRLTTHRLDLGKIPPSALDIEEAVIGAILLEKQALMSVIPFLKVEHFYKEPHQLIYKAVLDLFGQSNPIDTRTVINQLKVNGDLETVGGPFYIAQLTNEVASSTNTEYHARIILQKFMARDAIRISANALNALYEDTVDIHDALGKEITDLNDLYSSGSTKKAVKLAQLVDEDIESQKKPDVMGLKTGFTALDKAILGYNQPDLVIIAGRPGSGKTAFSLSSLRALGANKVPVAFFSLEMSAMQLESRLVSIEADVNNEFYRRRKLNPHDLRKVEEAYVKLKSYPIYIDDTPALTIVELKAKALALKVQHKIKAVFVDYLQLMTGEGKSVEEVVSKISSGLKAMAKELKVPVIALAQLNRAVEGRNDRKPQLSDLRSSGSIEQDADIAIFLFRPSYYKITTNTDGSPIPENYAEGLIEKNRNGRTGPIPLNWHGPTMTYSDWQQESILTDEEPNF